MKKLFAFACCLLSIVCCVCAQEELLPLKGNTAQQLRAQRYQLQHANKMQAVTGTILLDGATLQLPFVDDFSTDKTTEFGWAESHITASYTHVLASCFGVYPELDYYNLNLLSVPSYTYTYDTLLHQVDSVADASFPFNLFAPSATECFENTPSPTVDLWWPYFRYAFDSAGNKIDSLYIDQPSTPYLYMPELHFADAQPNTLWLDNSAYINNTYPVLPPTIGVATFDGLKNNGEPYDDSNVDAQGYADILTSQPIDLTGLDDVDSFYLSFFYEPMGLGDWPNETDSLILEFRNANTRAWDRVWSTKGFTSEDSFTNAFKHVMVKMPQTTQPQIDYIWPQTQFRFRNKASLTGNNDHWHIDYVRFDKNRTVTDTAINDRAFVYPFPSVLKNFEQMPGDQFAGNSDLIDTVNLLTTNLDLTSTPATNFSTRADELYPGNSVLLAPVVQTYNAAQYFTISMSPSVDYSLAGITLPQDSMVFLSSAGIGGSDAMPANDTIRQAQIFCNTYAYDDASAERAYSLTGVGVKKFGYQFELAQPDTFAAFQVHFAHLSQNVSDLIFNFYLWDNLVQNQVLDTPIYELVNKKPLYIDTLNGFATYVVDSPLLLPAGDLYFGWAQTDDRPLQIGFDMNSAKGRPHMFRYFNGAWGASQLPEQGSPMIHLIFDTDYWGQNSGTGIVDLTNREAALHVYPNPAHNTLLFDKRETGEAEISVFDATGRRWSHTRSDFNRVEVSELPAGFYILQVLETQSGKRYTARFIKAE